MFALLTAHERRRRGKASPKAKGEKPQVRAASAADRELEKASPKAKGEKPPPQVRAASAADRELEKVRQAIARVSRKREDGEEVPLAQPGPGMVNVL